MAKNVTVSEINNLFSDWHSQNENSHKIKLSFINGDTVQHTFVSAQDETSGEMLVSYTHIGFALDAGIQYYMSSLACTDIPTQADMDRFNDFYKTLLYYFRRWAINELYIVVLLSKQDFARYFIVSVPRAKWDLHINDMGRDVKVEFNSLQKERTYRIMVEENSQGFYDSTSDVLEAYAKLLTSLVLGLAEISESTELVDFNGNSLTITKLAATQD